jgi:hypothetical protein
MGWRRAGICVVDIVMDVRDGFVGAERLLLEGREVSKYLGSEAGVWGGGEKLGIGDPFKGHVGS